MVGDILQPTHLLLILVVALLVLGPKRLPEVGRSIGKGIHDFKDAINFMGDRPEQLASAEVPKPAAEPADRVT